MYGTVANVITMTGVTPNDLTMDTELELENAITLWLEYSTDLINEYNQQTYEIDTPLLINMIAEMIASNVVRQAIVSREGNIIQVSEFATKIQYVNLLTPDVIELLNRVKSKRRKIKFI